MTRWPPAPWSRPSLRCCVGTRRPCRGQGDPLPLDALAAASAACHPETHETLHVLLMELVPDIVATLRDGLAVQEEMATQPVMSVGTLRDILHADYAWALAIDAESPTRDYVWYKSIAAEEPPPRPPGRGRRRA